MTDVQSIGIGARAIGSGATVTAAVVAHNPGDLLRVHVTYPSDGSGGNGGYQHQIPAGFVEAQKGKYSSTVALQAELYTFDAAGLTTVAITRNQVQGNMTVQVEVLRGVDTTAPVAVQAPVTPAQSATVQYTVGLIPAGAYAVVDFAANSGYTILASPAPTATWTIGTATTTATQNRFMSKSFPAATYPSGSTPGVVGFTADGSKFYNAFAVAYLPSAAITTTNVTVAGVSGDGVLYGAAANIVAGLNDTDNVTTGFVFASSGGQELIVGTPAKTPAATEGYRCVVQVQRNGGVSGSWQYDLMEGGVSRGTITLPSTGTSVEAQTVTFTAAMCNSIGSPGTYWAAGPVVQVTGVYA